MALREDVFERCKSTGVVLLVQYSRSNLGKAVSLSVKTLSNTNLVASRVRIGKMLLLCYKFCGQRRWCCYATFSLGKQNERYSCICHNVNTQNVKIARRDRPHFLASRRCETFENLLHIDIAPLWSTVQHRKNVFVCRTLYYRQLIQLTRSPVELVVRFIRYQNRVKVSTFSYYNSRVSVKP